MPTGPEAFGLGAESSPAKPAGAAKLDRRYGSTTARGGCAGASANHGLAETSFWHALAGMSQQQQPAHRGLLQTTALGVRLGIAPQTRIASPALALMRMHHAPPRSQSPGCTHNTSPAVARKPTTLQRAEHALWLTPLPLVLRRSDTLPSAGSARSASPANAVPTRDSMAAAAAAGASPKLDRSNSPARPSAAVHLGSAAVPQGGSPARPAMAGADMFVRQAAQLAGVPDMP